jgi:hypothetical protein
MNARTSYASIFEADAPNHTRVPHSAASPTASPRISLDPENVKKGLGQLVLTVVELIRQLLEKQALRRIEAGSLSDEEIERLGLTFLELNTQLTWLKSEFGLTDEDLNLDLGPLGKLL